MKCASVDINADNLWCDDKRVLGMPFKNAECMKSITKSMSKYGDLNKYPRMFRFYLKCFNQCLMHLIVRYQIW